MNYVDIFLLVILVLGAVRGYSKGLVVELFSLIAFFFGLFGAIKFSGPIAAMFFGESDFYTIGLVGVFIVLFIALSVLINLLAKLIKKGVDLIFLGWIDNILGGLLGIVKWGFLVSMLVLMLKAGGMLLPQRDLDKSRIYPYIENIGPSAFNALDSVFPFLENFIDSINEEKDKHFV